MEKVSKELLKEFVNSQHFSSTTEIMKPMLTFNYQNGSKIIFLSEV